MTQLEIKGDFVADTHWNSQLISPDVCSYMMEVVLLHVEIISFTFLKINSQLFLTALVRLRLYPCILRSRSQTGIGKIVAEKDFVIPCVLWPFRKYCHTVRCY